MMARETIRSLVTKDGKYAALTKTSRGYEIAMDGRRVLLSTEAAQVLGPALAKAALNEQPRTSESNHE